MSDLRSRDHQKPGWIQDIEAAAGVSISLGERRPSVGGEPRAILVIDRSGSMQGENIRQAADGARRFARDAIRLGYAVGVALFGSTAELIHAPSRDIQQLEHSLEALTIEGWTNMAAGIDLAVENLPGARQRVICVVTDGYPDNAEKAAASAEEARLSGIEIMAVGTTNADWAFLSSIITRRDLGTIVHREALGNAIAGMSQKLLKLPRG